MPGAFSWSRRVGLGTCRAFIYAGESPSGRGSFLDSFELSVLAAANFWTASLKACFSLRFSF